MKRSISALLLCLLSVPFGARMAIAGGVQDIIDLTDLIPSPAPGEFITPVIPIRWDSRCVPNQFKVNNTMDPIPNPLGPAFLTVAKVTQVMQQAADTWKAVPTAFVDTRVSGTTSNPGAPRTDFINEITFRTGVGFPPSTQQALFSTTNEGIATVRITRIVTDFFFNDGLDVDGDGDSDASSAISSCRDWDGDGDIEMAAGFYEAGTILDTDIAFNAGVSSTGTSPPGFRFTTEAAQADTNPRSVDLLGIAVQALGISYGIAHIETSQKGPQNGTGSAMFPFTDTSDPQAEFVLRTLDIDSIASISAHYPEGSEAAGPGALQPGDQAVEDVFGFIEGEIRRDGDPVLGGNVYAVNHLSGEVVSTAISGTAQLSSTPDAVSSTFFDIDFHGIDGKYRLLVPPGLYSVGVEAIDGQPVRHFNANIKAITANILGQNTYEEEFYNGSSEATLERRPDERSIIRVRAGETVSGIDIAINRTTSIANYGSFDRRGLATAQPGSYYAVRIPKEQYLAADAGLGGRSLILAAAFLTGVEDASVVPVFAEALLTTGKVNPNGTATLDLKNPLKRQQSFAGQDFDFTPFWFDNSAGLSQKVRNGIAQGKIGDLFMVLRLPNGPFPGVSGTPPLIGLDGGVTPNDVPINGLSYRSTNGAVFTPDGEFNYMFKLILEEEPR